MNIEGPTTTHDAAGVNPQLVFRSEKRGTRHFTIHTLVDNEIYSEIGEPPDCILKIRRKLEAERSLTTKQQV